ncbi:hypothetical protein M9Y10_012504 [Tritrichomonas musculus]|uniref:Uncharacterized protein n=1 Tax=Tritrichomonas musculus TaxID=1915356 RepID=A0ABR2ICM2_9EUKA
MIMNKMNHDQDEDKFIFDLNNEMEEEAKDDLINIQLSSNLIQVHYYQIFKYSELIQEGYNKKEAIDSLPQYIQEIQDKYHIDEDNLVTFFKMIKEEKIEIKNSQYSDLYRLSKLFQVKSLQRSLNKYAHKFSKNINFIINLMVDHHRNKNDEIFAIDDFSKEMEIFLVNNINECLVNESFQHLPVSVIYRMIDQSRREDVSNDLLYEFIMESIDSRFVLFSFVNIEKLTEKHFEDLCEQYSKWKGSEIKRYCEYLTIDILFIKRMKDEKIRLDKEHEKQIQEMMDKNILLQTKLKELTRENKSLQDQINKTNDIHEIFQKNILKLEGYNNSLQNQMKKDNQMFRDQIKQTNDALSNAKSVYKIIKSLDYFKNSIQNLKNAIDEDQEEMKTFFEEKIKIENEQRKAKEINETRSLVSKYNEILLDILHSDKHKEINDKVKNLKVYHSQLQAYPELFKKEGIDLVTFKYQSSNDFVLNVKKNNEQIKIKIPKSYYQKDQYLYPGEEIRREDNSNIWYHITKVTVTHFDYIKEYFDLDAIISRSTNVSSRKPVIVFGNKYQDSKVFLETLDNIYKELTSLDEKFFAVLEFDPNIRSDIFSYIEKINNSLQSVKNNLQVEFSDHSPAPNSKRILQGEMKDYLDNLYQLINDLKISK